MKQPSGSPASPTIEDRSTQFVAVEGGSETTSAEALLVAAYGLMWALLLGFLLLTWRRQRKLEDKVERLGREIERAAGQSPGAP